MLKVVDVGVLKDASKLVLIREGEDILLGFSLPCVLDDKELEAIKHFFERKEQKKLILCY